MGIPQGFLSRECLNNYLLKYGSKKLFIFAEFCLLAKGDGVAAKWRWRGFSARI